MNRFTSLAVLFVLLRVAPIFAGEAVPASATTQPDMTVLEKLDDTLQVRRQANSFSALVDLTRPNLVWGGRDMLWITRDDFGKPGFAMNRAYPLQVGRDRPAWYLMESHDFWLDTGDSPWIPYTYFFDHDPVVVARDRARGVIYQARWTSAPESGSGACTSTLR